LLVEGLRLPIVNQSTAETVTADRADLSAIGAEIKNCLQWRRLAARTPASFQVARCIRTNNSDDVFCSSVLR
jgi:hypothetical protein